MEIHPLGIMPIIPFAIVLLFCMRELWLVSRENRATAVKVSTRQKMQSGVR